MKKYRCKESFCIGKYDDNGFFKENAFIIKEGEIFELNKSTHRVIGSEVRLDNRRKWIEISREWLEEYFELVEER